MSVIDRRRLLATTIIAGALTASAPSFAQVAAPAADETLSADAGADIVVTGSRIARPNLEQSSPVSVIDSAELQARAPVSVEQVLRQLPGAVAGINPGVNNGTTGIASVNLRNLGTNRNLVLLNGRRVVPSTLTGVVDLNVIPVALIERTDILTGGAVTTYGADAIAGVNNFVTKRDFSGLQADAQYGVAEQGDGQGYRIDLTTGANFDDGRGNAVLGLSYTKTKPVLQGDRSIGQVSRASNCTAAQLTAGVCNLPRGAAQGSNTAAPASLFFPLPTTAVDPTRSSGARFDPVTGTIAPGLTDYNFNPLNYYQTPLDRWNIFGSAHYEVTPNIEVYGEGFFVRSRVTQNLAPTGTFTEPFQVPLNNQFLTPTQRTQLCSYAGLADCATAIAAGTEIQTIAGRRFVETGPRVANITSNVFQVTAGVRGKLISNLSFDLFGQYGEAERTRVDTGTALRSRVQQALRGCPTGSSTGCTPINIFGAEGSLTPAMLAFVGVPTTQRTNTELGIVQGVISGDFGLNSPLSEKPIGIAVGAEYRRYGGSQLGDLPNQQPGEILGAGGAFLTVDGEFSSKEVFGELNLPLISDRPFFYDLTIDAGIRYADYTTTGTNTTWKVGGSWAPVRDFNFRGAYTRAVRAPNINELFLPTNTILNNLAVDPCQGNVTNATTRALCIAQLAAVGLPAARLGDIQAPLAGQINVTNPGTPNLDSERATTITAGIVLRPTSIEWARGFTATLDWYRIRVRGAITTPTVGDILNGCFAQTNPTDSRCQLIRRNPATGGLSGSPATTPGITLLQSNQGFLETEGVDFTISYARDFGDIRFSNSLNGNYTDKSRQQSNANSFIRECVGQYSVSCESPLPRWSWQYRATVGYDKVDLSGLWRRIGYLEYERRTGATPTTTPAVGTVGSFGSVNPATIIPAYRNIPAFNYFDVNVGYNISEQFRLSFLVENLFNKQPPEVGNTIGSTSFNSGNTYPSLYDVVGRRFTVATRLRF
ncbi:MAG: TonB-dependent receptor [Sphingomonas fennica]